MVRERKTKKADEPDERYAEPGVVQGSGIGENADGGPDDSSRNPQQRFMHGSTRVGHTDDEDIHKEKGSMRGVSRHNERRRKNTGDDNACRGASPMVCGRQLGAKKPEEPSLPADC